MCMRMRPITLTLFVLGFLIMFSMSSFADEYGSSGAIPGVDFTGGDGSYKRVVRDGIVLGIAPDKPWTYQDEKTHDYAGLDVSIFRDVTRRLGITKVTWQIMQFYGLITAFLAKSLDEEVHNIHENP